MLSSPVAAIFCLIAGAIMVIFGHGFKDRVSFLAGCICISAGVIFGFTDLVDMLFSSGWVELAVFGASAIALGSVLDRHGVAMKLRLSKWISQISSDAQSKREIGEI